MRRGSLRNISGFILFIYLFIYSFFILDSSINTMYWSPRGPDELLVFVVLLVRTKLDIDGYTFSYPLLSSYLDMLRASKFRGGLRGDQKSQPTD